LDFPHSVQIIAKRIEGKKGKHHRWFSNAHVVENITVAQMSTHEAFGMLYTSFREEVWWWEITVTLRKIVIVGIGVFGESMGEMQVHVTLLCIVIVLLCTAVVQPYGKRQLLNYLELVTLTAIWLTLWAGNVFNANPRCEDGKGGTVAWCDTMSMLIGVIDAIMLVAVVATMVYYKKQKQCDSYLRKRFHRRQNLKNNAANEDEKQGFTSFLNPNLDAATANDTQQIHIEMTSTSTNHDDDDGSAGKNNTLPGGWSEHKTDDGNTYYVNHTSGKTQWNKPSHHKRNSTTMPKGWMKADTEEGERYYMNGEGHSQWKPPIGSSGGSAELGIN
jgi:hypothetical protein